MFIAYSNVPIGIAYNTNFYDISGANLEAALAFNIRLSDSLVLKGGSKQGIQEVRGLPV